MPPRAWRERLEDILSAIADIQSDTAGMGFDQFSSDATTLRSVIFSFVVIGEAVRALPKEFTREHPNMPWQDMLAMRNFVVHVYFGIDAKRVWDTVHKNLPPLVPMIQAILERPT